MVTEQKKKEKIKKKKPGMGPPFSSLLFGRRHTGMTPGPRAGSGGKGRGEEVKTVRQHNLINLCQTPPQVDQAGE